MACSAAAFQGFCKDESQTVAPLKGCQLMVYFGLMVYFAQNLAPRVVQVGLLCGSPPCCPLSGRLAVPAALALHDSMCWQP